MNRRLEDLLYAPIGLIAGASRFIPELAEHGRIQVANARVMGQMATRLGSDKIAGQLGGAVDRANALLIRAGLFPPAADETTDDVAGGVVEAHADTVGSDEPDSIARSDAPAADELAIVDYDSLAASQVVPRLMALKPDELEAVRRYEFANRARKTILGRVAQLQN